MAGFASRTRIASAAGALARALRGVPALAWVGLAILGVRPSAAACPAQCQSPVVWTQAFTFAGLTWERKSGCGGPGPNCWVPANAEPVAGDGIHMRLTRVSGKWYSGEIRTTAPVGYGGYSVYVVGRPDLLDPNVVLGIFLYDDAAGEGGEPCPAELDVESSRFGDPAAPNGHSVVYVSQQCGPADLFDFTYSLTGTYTTHQINWSPGTVQLRMLHGHRCGPELPEQVIAERTFTSPQVPAAGQMRLHINLWAFAGDAPTNNQEVEIVIRDIVPSCAVLAAEPPVRAADRALAVRPNPSQGGADILFDLPRDEHARLTVVDVTGRRVATLADGAFPAGRHRLHWVPAPRVPGVYFASLEVNGRQLMRRVVLLE